MPIINPDLTEVTSGVIEPGTYKAKIDAVEFKTAKSSGNPMIVVDFSVHVKDLEYTRKAYLVITGAGAFNFEQLLRATHFDEVADKLKAGEKIDFNTDDLVGQELNVVVEADSYNGQLTDKVRSYIKL